MARYWNGFYFFADIDNSVVVCCRGWWPGLQVSQQVEERVMACDLQVLGLGQMRLFLVLVFLWFWSFAWLWTRFSGLNIVCCRPSSH
ncbi:unnamed protein product [Ilex paraguariensis]|uniref:Uncharacterized protein n=1 Tax=Ilex paraguariensis TaxID=185542 RepID=A0ABC8TUX6_9AQUA